MRNKIIGYVSAEDPFRDKKAWSGTKYKIREALQNAGYEVCLLYTSDAADD